MIPYINSIKMEYFIQINKIFNDKKQLEKYAQMDKILNYYPHLESNLYYI